MFKIELTLKNNPVLVEVVEGDFYDAHNKHWDLLEDISINNHRGLPTIEIDRVVIIDLNTSKTHYIVEYPESSTNPSNLNYDELEHLLELREEDII
jgi:hypothetical protein|tara:strand:- start:426 stop:713 length:288 start_codon:yes stop_codon:yes gene_type:complete